MPVEATVVDLRGKFVIPGLIDGFCGMQSQAEASAQLYEGVTTIVASGDDRRGLVFLAADPSPQVYLADIAGSTDDWSLLRGDPQWRERLRDGDAPHELGAADTRAQIDETARRGTRVLWIGRGITSANTVTIVEEARRTGLATYGEFISTPYASGIRAGVGSLLHMTRFELGLAPENLIDAAATDPRRTGRQPRLRVGRQHGPAQSGRRTIRRSDRFAPRRAHADIQLVLCRDARSPQSLARARDQAP